MKIFDKRPLSLILCIMLGGFVFFSYAPPSYRLATPIIAVILFIISFFFFTEDKRKRLTTRFASLALLIAVLFSYVYFDVYFPIYNRYGENLEIVATVDEIDASTSPRKVTLITKTINGVDEEGFKLFAELGFNILTNVSEGAEVKFTGSFTDLSGAENHAAALNLKSRGYSAEVNVSSKIEVLAVNDFDSSFDLEVYRDNLARRAVLNSDADSGGLLSAILLGNKTYLNPQTALDFQRTGTSHILALSGMHLAILTLAIGNLLTLLNVNKKYRKIFEIIFVALYMALTGFSASVVRAGIMLIISSLLFLLSHKSDSITSLFITVALICVFDPCTVFDVSLWLSALATLGILILSEMNERKNETSKVPIYKQILKNVLFAFIASVFAMSATMLITAFSFHASSPLGLIITPLISPVISLFMNLGAIFLFVADFLPLGAAVSFVGDFISDVMGFFASLDGIYTSTDFSIVKLLIFVFSVCFFLFVILEIKRKKTAISVMCVLLAASFATSIITSAKIKNEVALDYSTSNVGETFYISSEGENAIIDTSSPTYYTALTAASEITDRGLTEIDSYIFTNYSSNMSEAVKSLLHSVKVDTVYIPTPVTKEENEQHKALVRLSEIYNAKFTFYGTDDMLFLGEATYFPTYRSSEDEKLAFTLKYGDEFYSYVSPKMLETNTKAVAFSIISGCHTLILGSHGSSDITQFSYNLDNVENLILSSKSFEITDNVTRGEHAPKVHVDPTHISLIH